MSATTEKRKSPTFVGTVVCAECGREVLRRSVAQKYCPDCSAIKSIERKAKWAKQNPQEYTESQRRAAKKRGENERSEARERGAAISDHATRSITWLTEPQLLWLTRVSIPFTYSWSKNSIYSHGEGGHVGLRQEARSVRAQLTATIIEAITMHGVNVVPAKLWIDIFVQKPDHRGDAINVVDLVCDAAKDALPIDDRWFAIRRLDWEIAKNDPMLFVGIGQETDEEQRVCSHCGRVLPADQFKAGRRECPDCRGSGGHSQESP